jgi:hypothetical protein
MKIRTDPTSASNGLKFQPAYDPAPARLFRAVPARQQYAPNRIFFHLKMPFVFWGVQEHAEHRTASSEIVHKPWF